MTPSTAFCGLLFVSGLLAQPQAQPGFALRNGDTVLFYGDSITQQQLYTVYVEDFVRTRYPDLKVRFYNRGWSGDTVYGGGGGDAKKRCDRDVKPIDPSVITVMLGMNDGHYLPYDPKTFNEFNDGYAKLLQYLREDAPHARFTLIQTSPWDDFAHTHGPYAADSGQTWQGYNDVLLQYGQVVKALASRDHDLFVDFNQPVASMLKKAAGDDPPDAQQIVPDSVHPGPAGHLVMAAALIEAWGASPIVADVELDAISQAVDKTQNAKVDGFDGLKWTERDGSLPFVVNPKDKTIRLASTDSDFEQNLNQENLRVTHLLKGTYELLIDDQSVGSFDSDQLAQGINLADYPTPMRAQALEVLELTARRSQLDFTRWRQVEIDEASMPSMKSASEAMYKLENDIEYAEIQAAQPRSHRYVLKQTNPARS